MSIEALPQQLDTTTMEGPLFSNPQAKVQAALTLAGSEFEANINLGAYSEVPIRHFGELYEMSYYKLAEKVVTQMKTYETEDELFGCVVEVAKNEAMTMNDEAVEMAKMELANQLGEEIASLPGRDKHEEVRELMEEVNMKRSKT